MKIDIDKVSCPECKSKKVGFICTSLMDRLAFVCKECQTIFIITDPRQPTYIVKITSLEKRFPLALRQRTKLIEKIRNEIQPKIFDEIGSSDQKNQLFIIKKERKKKK